MKKFTIILLIFITSVSFAAPWGHRYNVEQPWQNNNVQSNTTLTVSVEWGEGNWDGADGSAFGFGSSKNGSGWTWIACSWFENGSGGNKRCKTNVTFTSTGTNWYAYRMIKAANGGTTYQHGSDAWSENTNLLEAVSYVVVENNTNSPAPGGITIGQGPVLGTLFGENTYYEEFMDWKADDLRGLDPQGDAVDVDPGDGHYWSRDIIAAYSRMENGTLYFKVDYFDLALNAENGNLDTYILIDCKSGGNGSIYPDSISGTPMVQWDFVICVYDAAGNSTLKTSIDLGKANYLGEYFRSDLDGMECGISTQALHDAGWDGSSAINFEVMTVKDSNTTRADTTGSLNTGTTETKRAKYAAILHANQSLNKVDGIGSHIHHENITSGLDTGFRRALETHDMFNFPANYHLSGTLLAAMKWGVTPKSTSNEILQDGPIFIDYLKEFVDNNQNDGKPGALIGGVFAEHIMPYFEGNCNKVTIDLFTDVMSNYFDLMPNDVDVMHVPERVIRSTTTGMTPLDGRTFEDVDSSDYSATYLDEVNHLHFWFYPSESPWAGFKTGNSGIDTSIGEQSYQHKIHKINGVYCFMINDREDNSKFWNQDDGLRIDTRYTLLEKARSADQAQITVIFDDWEAYAGRSFTDQSGNDNYKLWNKTARWIANHPWIKVVTLKDALTTAKADEASWVINQGTVTNKEPSTYEWLRHACKDATTNPKQSYDNWYYGTTFNNGEEDFYSYVPKVMGSTALPSGKKHGDLNTSGSLMHDAWDAVENMPDGRLKKLAQFSYASMIYETAWHDESDTSYQGSGYKPPWPSDDNTYDAISGWALRLQNHTRDVGVIAEAAHWATNVLHADFGTNTITREIDLDFDGENEYIIANNLIFACFEKYGGRLIKAFAIDWCPEINAYDAREIIGSPISNPSDETEAELEAGNSYFNRCSSFRDSGQVDSTYSVSSVAKGFTFSSGGISKTIILQDGRDSLDASYTASGTTYVRFGLVPNNLDLLMKGQDVIEIDSAATYYGLINTNAGGRVYVKLGANTSINATPSDAGYLNRVQPLTEQVEIAGSGNFSVSLAASKDNDGIPDSYELANGLDPNLDDGEAARYNYLINSQTIIPEPVSFCCLPFMIYYLLIKNQSFGVQE